MTQEQLASRESSPEPLVRVNDVARYFDVSPPLLNRLLGGERRRILKAVDGVSFSVPRGKTFALVGESGCGKSTLARVIVGLHRPTRGSVEFDGVDIGALRTRRRMAAVRRRLQMVFQDPYASLNPRWRVRDIIAEPIRTYRLIEGRLELTKRVHELLTHVGLSPEDDSKYPHEFSGGQRQRISIARALASKPDFIVFDEPTSALDVSIQAQILNLMNDLQREMGLTYLLISHNLAVVYHIADLVGVMYLGQIVELNTVKSLFSAPQHPYTRMLLDIVSDLRMPGRDRIPVQGEVPSPLDPPSGCAFHPRCRFADARCQRERPRSTQYDGKSVACHAVEEGRLTTSSGMAKPETGPPSDH